MKRTQLQLDDDTFERLRTRAHAERRSIASLIREALARLDPPRQPPRVPEFQFIGLGQSTAPAGRPVSEDHDRVLAEAAAPKQRTRRS